MFGLPYIEHITQPPAPQPARAYEIRALPHGGYLVSRSDGSLKEGVAAFVSLDEALALLRVALQRDVRS